VSVVHLALKQPTLEQVTGLIATRNKRELQSVFFHRVVSVQVAVAMVCTDPLKRWTYRGFLSENVGSVLCTAAVNIQAATRCNSLTVLDVGVASSDCRSGRLFYALSQSSKASGCTFWT
jgi:hypothetical protein